jgi:hypothetical protein
MPPALARHRLALPAVALRVELQHALGSRIGSVQSLSALRAYRLHERVRSDVHAHRCVAIGNAAQTLHPVAGQGFNLALRDCPRSPTTRAGAASTGPRLRPSRTGCRNFSRHGWHRWRSRARWDLLRSISYRRCARNWHSC